MTAHHHRGQAVVRAGAAGKHIAHFIHTHGAACRLAPLCEEFAALFVEVGEGQTLAAALGRAADFGHFHQRVPEPLAINAHIGKVRHSCPPQFDIMTL